MRHSATARLLVMAGLALALLIPLTWVQSIVSERTQRRDAAVSDVSATWGGQQLVAGPVLSIPYTVTWTDNSGRSQRAMHQAFALPRDLRIDGRLATETRSRGIFDVAVYRASLKITGTFVRPDLTWVRVAPEAVDWSQAALQMGVTDPRGIVRRAGILWRGQPLPLSGGTVETGLFRTGLRAAVPALDDTPVNAELPFELTLELNGTRDLRFLPSAEETHVSLSSSWRHPSFAGAPLPETRNVSAVGFEASWRVQDFGRSYPARWTSAGMNQEQLANQATASAFGVSLIQPVDVYQQSERAVKYAVLFIVFTFLVFFLWEVFSATLLHPMQYTFVGFAMCVFYLLLVSISEHTGFDFAYGVSSVVTTALVAGYAKAVLRGLRQASSVLGALVLLYGLLYLLLRLEDYALIAGSVAVFIVLAVVMFITRRMNWYDLRLGGAAPDRAA